MLYATNDEIASLNGAIEAYGIMIAYVAYGFVLGRIVGPGKELNLQSAIKRKVFMWK